MMVQFGSISQTLLSLMFLLVLKMSYKFHGNLARRKFTRNCPYFVFSVLVILSQSLVSIKPFDLKKDKRILDIISVEI